MLQAVAEAWEGLAPEIQSAAIAAVVTVVTATLGALLVVWQIGTQAGNAIRQNQHNEALKLKLDVYKELVSKSRAAAHSEVDLSSYVRGFSTSLDIVRQLGTTHAPWAIPKERPTTFIQKNTQLSDDVIELISLTERWQIIDPRIEIFRTAINVAKHDVQLAFQTYFSTALRAMPTENLQDGSLFPWRQPSPDLIKEIEQLGNSFQKALLDLGSFIYDIQVEMQNLLLGELFGNKLSPRRPLDPHARVVQLDRWKELAEYFENETNWGREKARTEARVRQDLS